MSQHKIAVIGTREVCTAFKLLGAEAVPVCTPDQALQELLRLKKETESGQEPYAIIFITEDLTSSISCDDEKRLARGALPAIIPLPTQAGSTGYGLERIKRIVERAVGSDILA